MFYESNVTEEYQNRFLRYFMHFLNSSKTLTPPGFSFEAGSSAVDYILDHAEIDIVFVQDKKVKEVSINCFKFCI